MDLIHNAWRRPPTNSAHLRAASLASADAVAMSQGSGGAQQATILADYAGAGGAADWLDTPTYQTPPAADPHNAVFNELLPITWTEYVITDEEINAMLAVGLTVTPRQVPATFSPPQGAQLGVI